MPIKTWNICKEKKHSLNQTLKGSFLGDGGWREIKNTFAIDKIKMMAIRATIP